MDDTYVVAAKLKLDRVAVVPMLESLPSDDYIPVAMLSLMLAYFPAPMDNLEFDAFRGKLNDKMQ